MIHCSSRFSTVCLPCRQLGPPNFVVESTARRPNGNPNVKCAHGPANQERRWHFCSLPCLSIVWLSHQSPLVSFRFSTYCINIYCMNRKWLLQLLHGRKWLAVTTAPWTEMAVTTALLYLVCLLMSRRGEGPFLLGTQKITSTFSVK